MNNKICILLALFACGLSQPAKATLILGTDFSGRTVSGNTADNIIWTTDGVADPGSLTAVDVNSTGLLAGLFDTAAAQNHFAPNLNVDNEGPWSATVTLSLITPLLLLENVVIDYQHFSNSGVFQNALRTVNWTASVTGSASGLIDAVMVNGTGSTSGSETLTFTTPLSLNNLETYDVTILAEGVGPGNNTGFAELALNGTVIPEPSSFLLLGFGALLLRARLK